MFKTTLKSLGRIIVSGIIALVILNLFSFFYYRIRGGIINEDGSTNRKSEANTFYFCGTEGFGWGKVNNDGFPNMFDYEENMRIDVLIMGSSHMEARQVGISQTTASRLNALLENETVYNIGYSGHNFLICAGNLRAALKRYQPTQYVVIETTIVSFSDDQDQEIVQIINDEVPEVVINRRATGIIAKIFDLLRMSSYFRLIELQKNQYFNNLKATSMGGGENSQVHTKTNTMNNGDLLNDLLHQMSILADEYGAKLIIAYHPSISISSDGTLNLNTDQDATTRFKQLCDTNEILFLDMGNRFKEEYDSAYILPYGFFNTPVGSGHLNKYGHTMMAEELYKLILEDKQ